MKKTLFVMCLMCFSISTWSQKIEINSEGVKYNSMAVTKQMTKDDVQKIFGEPDRKIWLPASSVWTYDKLGIRVGFNISTDRLSYVAADFVIGKWEQYPKSVFNGNILLYDRTITKTTPLKGLQTIVGLKFKDLNNKILVVATNEFGQVVWNKSETTGAVETFSFCF